MLYVWCAVLDSTLVLGVLAIFASNSWQWLPSDHSIIGISAVSVLFLNIIGGLCRPGTESKFRKAFNIIHGLMGIAAISLGTTALVFGVQFFEPNYNYTIANWVGLGMVVAMIPVFLFVRERINFTILNLTWFANLTVFGIAAGLNIWVVATYI